MLKIGIVGLPNVGKSTLFKALTKQKVEIANYPFATIDPNVGMVEVPDERLKKLALISHSKKIVPAIVTFVDIAGLVKGAAEGEGLGNKFLSHIKEVDAIAEVVRVFENQEIIHVAGAPNPISDIEVLEYELVLKDLEIITKRLESLQTDMRARKKGAEEKMEICKHIQTGLKQGKLGLSIINNIEKNKQEILEELLKELELLTAKPIIYVFNVSEEQLKNKWTPDKNLREKIGTSSFVVLSLAIEAELSDLTDEEKIEYLKTLGQEKSGLDQLIQMGYGTLRLITFFTTGEDETRAWTIPKNSLAPRAGRAIHSDFEEKFIRAEVINWQKLLEVESWAQGRELGLLRTEGKEYNVQDGDVVEFKI